MLKELMSTKDVALYLGVHEKQVYGLIKSGRLPATRVTGKWIFPKKLIDEWLEESAKAGLSMARQKSRVIYGALLGAGSNDPALDYLQTCMRKQYPDVFIFSANTGSTEGLMALNKGYTDIAWSHLWDPQSRTYNVPYVGNYLDKVDAVVINLFYRDLGFLVQKDNPLSIKTFQDLTKKHVIFVNRQKGSGTRVFLDHHLTNDGIDQEKIKGYDNEVYTHLEVGLAVLSLKATVGIATASIARLLCLSFVPVTRESFEMILSKDTFFKKEVQALMDILSGDDFRTQVKNMGGYDFKDSGKIIHAKT
jgi:excisionase family DNA binding protein